MLDLGLGMVELGDAIDLGLDTALVLDTDVVLHTSVLAVPLVGLVLVLRPLHLETSSLVHTLLDRFLAPLMNLKLLALVL